MQQSLLHLDGVTNAVVELSEGWATFTLAPGKNLDTDAVQQLVEDVGMTLFGVQIEAEGEVVDQEGRLALRVSGSQQILPLEQNAQATRLAQALTDGRRQVTVTGTLSPSKGGAPPSLAVEDFQLH